MMERLCVLHPVQVDAANGSFFSGNQATHGGAISADGQAEVSSTQTVQPRAVSSLLLLLITT